MLDWIGFDPALAACNAHTGISDIQLLKQRGYTVHHRHIPIRDGIEAVRRLDHHTLKILPPAACT